MNLKELIHCHISEKLFSMELIYQHSLSLRCLPLYYCLTCAACHCQINVDLGEEERKDEEKPVISKVEERKDYNMGVLKQIQVIFGHLANSKLQYHVPRGFWKHFKSVLKM